MITSRNIFFVSGFTRLPGGFIAGFCWFHWFHTPAKILATGPPFWPQNSLGSLANPFWTGSAGPLVQWSADLLVRWTTGPPVRRSAGPPVCWSAGPPVRRPAGPLVPWSHGPPVCWSAVPPVCWSTVCWSAGLWCVCLLRKHTHVRLGETSGAALSVKQNLKPAVVGWMGLSQSLTSRKNQKEIRF